MQTLARVAKIAALPTLTSRMSMHSTPIRIEGRIGVPVRWLTWASCLENGSLPSRAIEYISREQAVWIARVQMRTAIATSASRTLPQNPPRIESKT